MFSFDKNIAISGRKLASAENDLRKKITQIVISYITYHTERRAEMNNCYFTKQYTWRLREVGGNLLYIVITRKRRFVRWNIFTEPKIMFNHRTFIRNNESSVH